MPSPSTRQGASAFNQPLSFDTSSVTTMYRMFKVRSARALGPQALGRAFSPCMPEARRAIAHCSLLHTLVIWICNFARLIGRLGLRPRYYHFITPSYYYHYY